jgi:hypothetical protein
MDVGNFGSLRALGTLKYGVKRRGEKKLVNGRRVGIYREG